MSSVRLNLYELTWEALQKERQSKLILLSLTHDAKYKLELEAELHKIETVLLVKNNGFKQLSNALKNYPGIDELYRKLKENKVKVADAKSATAKTVSTISTFLSDSYKYSWSLFGSPINQQSAAEAKLIADEALEEHERESLKGFASLVDQYTIKAINRLRPVYKAVSTNGSVKKAIADTITAYGFPLDDKAFDQKMAIRTKAIGMSLN